MNNDREKLETLPRKQALFACAGDDVIKKASEMVRIAEFGPGDYICFQGDRRSPRVLVISGQLRKSTLSEDGREIPVRVINPGQSGGGHWSLTIHPLAGTASPSRRVLWPFSADPMPGRCSMSPTYRAR